MERPSVSPFQPYCVQALGPGCGDRLELGLFKVGGVEKREMEVWTCRTSGSQRVSAGADRHERQRNNNKTHDGLAEERDCDRPCYSVSCTGIHLTRFHDLYLQNHVGPAVNPDYNGIRMGQPTQHLRQPLASRQSRTPQFEKMLIHLQKVPKAYCIPMLLAKLSPTIHYPTETTIALLLGL